MFWLASFISFFFRAAPLKFLADTMFFWSDSSLGILFFIYFIFYYNFVASEEALAFLNSNYFILSLVPLCFYSNTLRLFVLSMKV